MAIASPNTANLPPFIKRANELYASEPIGAALVLFDGVCLLDTHRVAAESEHSPHASPKTHRQSLIDVAYRNLTIMAEDAQTGIAPTRGEWDLIVSMAESIVQMITERDD